MQRKITVLTDITTLMPIVIVVVKSVIAVRDDLQTRYSKSWYDKEVKRLMSSSKKGFWSGAYLVKKGK